MVEPCVLNRDQVRSILSLYHLDDLEDFGDREPKASSVSYWVVVEGVRYVLRIAHQKKPSDMIYEKELLLFLQEKGMSVPRLVPNVAQGTFMPWSSRGRYISLFHDMPGRPLGLFEVRSKHTRALGEAIAKVHASTRSFKRVRLKDTGPTALSRGLGRLVRGLERGRLPLRFAEDLATIAVEAEAQASALAAADVATGTVIGDVSLGAVRFSRDRLVGFASFEAAHTGLEADDIAEAVMAWCWVPSASQRGGPAGRLSVSRVRALLDGYRSVKALSPDEEASLPRFLRRAAVRSAIERMTEFELKHRAEGRYLDYRHSMEHLRALAAGRAEALIDGCRRGVASARKSPSLRVQRR